MKKIIPIAGLIIITFLLAGFYKADNGQKINPVMGDISFLKKFGRLPDKYTDGNLRIITHLEYVESLLRKKDVSHLSSFLQQKRLDLINLLHEYRTAGVFPGNYDYPGKRKPCFIDKDNRLCAVGYLVEKTAGRRAAENINRKYKYNEIFTMNDTSLDDWIANSGLTKEECAMIQPQYGYIPTPTENHISSSYGISSSAFCGINFSLNVLNALQMLKGTTGKMVPAIGLITGAGQVVLGVAAFPKDGNSFNGRPANESKKTLSMVNIGIGTTTMLLSAWNLIQKKKKTERSSTINLYSLPAGGSKMNVGLSFTKTIR